MSYGRILETGHYIWPDETGINFDNIHISNELMDIFLFKLYNEHHKEMLERIQNGKDIINKIGDIYE